MRKRNVKTSPISIVGIALKFARIAKKEAVERTLKRDMLTTNTVERLAYNAAEGAVKNYRNKLKWRGLL